MADRPIEFPQLRPTTREFEPGEYPQSLFEAQNGATIAIRYAKQQANSRLRLSFRHIPDWKAAQILTNYESVNAGWNYVEFTQNHPALDGMKDATLIRRVRGLDNQIKLKYRYAKPPDIRYVFMDICDVTCEFIGYLDGGLD